MQLNSLSCCAIDVYGCPFPIPHRQYELSNFVLPSQNCFACCSFFAFLRISITQSTQNSAKICIFLNVLNLFPSLERIEILMILSLSTHEHRICCHLFRFSLNSFISVYSSQHINVAFIFIRVPPKQFMFLTSVPNCLLLIYRSTTDFLILVLYPMTFLNSLISTGHFFCRFFGIYT